MTDPEKPSRPERTDASADPRKVAPHDSTRTFTDGWDRAELRANGDWRLLFDVQSVAEVRAHLVRHGSVLPRIHAAEFPNLGEVAASVVERLALRHGVMWLRPDPEMAVADMTDREYEAVFSILSSLMRMAHREIVPEEADGYRPSDSSRQPPPAELGTAMIDGLVPDVVGALRLSRRGRVASGESNGINGAPGEVYFVSGDAVHSELEAQHESHMRMLYRPTIQSDGDPMPIFRYEPQRRALDFRYHRSRISAAHAEAGVPIMRPLLHAFDALDKTMNLPHLLASIRPDRGDMVLVNNRRVATLGLLRTASADVRQVVRILRVVNPASRPAQTAPR